MNQISEVFKSGVCQAKITTRKLCYSLAHTILNNKCTYDNRLYRIIGKGAGGGLASGGVGSSRGALAVSVFELHKDEDIYILIGQQGQSACSQTNGKNKTDCIGTSRMHPTFFRSSCPFPVDFSLTTLFSSIVTFRGYKHKKSKSSGRYRSR